MPELLIVTGPPGAGKTTVAEILAGRHDRGVHVEADVFWRFIRSGHIEPWEAESHEQNATVIRGAVDAAIAYTEGGYFTVLDGIVGPRWFLEPVRARLAERGVTLDYAILRPRLEVALDRATGRRAEARHADALHAPAVIEQLYRGFTNLGEFEAHVIDSSNLSAAESAAEIESMRAAGRLRL